MFGEILLGEFSESVYILYICNAEIAELLYNLSAGFVVIQFHCITLF